MSTLQKFLAQFLAQGQARVAMNGTTRARAGVFVAACIGVAFAWTLLLSVSPQLHQRIHPDANRVEHTCAVTFVASGTYEHSAALLLIAPVTANTFARIADLNPAWVLSAFLGASIFEHAPPVNS
jgi:hypothetical protein